MTEWTPILILHVIASVLSVAVGAVVLVRRKGTASHKALGRVWVVLIYTSALSSFLITDIVAGEFSWLHILSIVTLITVTLGLIAIRRNNVRSHAGNMIGTWLGSTIAMVFALVAPSRAIPTFAVANPVGAIAALVAVIVTTAVLVFIGDRLARSSRSLQPRLVKKTDG